MSYPHLMALSLVHVPSHTNNFISPLSNAVHLLDRIVLIAGPSVTCPTPNLLPISASNFALMARCSSCLMSPGGVTVSMYSFPCWSTYVTWFFMRQPILRSVSAKALIGPATDLQVFGDVSQSGYTVRHRLPSSVIGILAVSLWCVAFHISAAHASAGELANLSVGSSCSSSVAVRDRCAALGLIEAPACCRRLCNSLSDMPYTGAAYATPGACPVVNILCALLPSVVDMRCNLCVCTAIFLARLCCLICPPPIRSGLPAVQSTPRFAAV